MDYKETESYKQTEIYKQTMDRNRLRVDVLAQLKWASIQNRGTRNR